MTEKITKKFVALLSGGLDSPVSTYLMLKKGYSGVLLSFLTGDDPEKKNIEKILKIARKIVDLTGNHVKLYIANHNETLEKFIECGSRKLTCIMCKRYMLRTARTLLLKENADFIINGDILGEQASQTLDNLVQVQKVLNDVPVIRPLIGFEKAEVIKISQQVGLYELSSLPTPGCDKNPRYPETHAKENEIKESEADVVYDKIAENILKNALIYEI